MDEKMIIVPLLLILMCACSSQNKEQSDEQETEIISKSPNEDEKSSGWEISYNTDEWGDPTDEKNAFGGFMGTFRNSATSDGRVAIAMFVKTKIIGEKLDTIIGFALGEYDGRHTVRDMHLKGKARNSMRDEKDFNLYIDKNGFGMIMSEMKPDLFKLLCKGGDIDVILEEETEYGVPSKYRFTIPSYLNISDAVSQINMK